MIFENFLSTRRHGGYVFTRLTPFSKNGPASPRQLGKSTISVKCFHLVVPSHFIFTCLRLDSKNLFSTKPGHKFPIKWKPRAVRPAIFLSHNLLDLRKLILSNIFEKKTFHFVAV